MINKTNFVYSAAAAARILGVKAHAIARFEVWAYVCFVHVKEHRPTFISKKVFRQHFVDWRIERSKFLCVSQGSSTWFRVVNLKKNTAYSVWAFADGLECECEDYKNQVMIFNGKGCCKHGYGV